MPRPIVIRMDLDIYFESMDYTVPEHDDVAKEIHDLLHCMLVEERNPDLICGKKVIAVFACKKE